MYFRSAVCLLPVSCCTSGQLMYFRSAIAVGCSNQQLFSKMLNFGHFALSLSSKHQLVETLMVRHLLLCLCTKLAQILTTDHIWPPNSKNVTAIAVACSSQKLVVSRGPPGISWQKRKQTFQILGLCSDLAQILTTGHISPPHNKKGSAIAVSALVQRLLSKRLNFGLSRCFPLLLVYYRYDTCFLVYAPNWLKS